jgi:hypothetical protein
MPLAHTTRFVQRQARLGGAAFSQTRVCGFRATPHASLEDWAHTALAIPLLARLTALCLQASSTIVWPDALAPGWQGGGGSPSERTMAALGAWSLDALRMLPQQGLFWLSRLQVQPALSPATGQRQALLARLTAQPAATLEMAVTRRSAQERAPGERHPAGPGGVDAPGDPGARRPRDAAGGSGVGAGPLADRTPVEMGEAPRARGRVAEPDTRAPSG